MSGMQGLTYLLSGFALIYSMRYMCGENAGWKIIYGVTGIFWSLITAANMIGI